MPENPSGSATPVGGGAVTTTSSQPVPATPGTTNPVPVGGADPSQPQPQPTPVGGATPPGTSPSPTPIGGATPSPQPGSTPGVTPIGGGDQPGQPQPQPVGGKFSAEDVRGFWAHTAEAFAGLLGALAKQLAAALKA